MEDEPLTDWAERRDRRLRGRLRVMTLAGGPQGFHVNPEAPRLISRWNGYGWEAMGVAANLAEARRLLYPETAGTDPTARPAPDFPPPPRGRHRRPDAPR
ncbi:DUF6087 family protein [Streptomyces gamaensis]|uniref:DUF6087 family protein n=1 Tax=Streptomyces gamaensis TaxID=1763542 RepID=A0ABW0YY97_9ACTN